jgi:outer membrane receptor protein involved in Fe transport
MDDAISFAQKSPQPFLTREQTIVGELNASQKMGKSNTVLVGIQAKRTDVEENTNGSGWFERYFQDVGVYLQDEWDIVEQFGFVAGLRYDHHQSEDNLPGSNYNENALNPRVSLKYKPVEFWTNRFSWGTGFRVPGDFSEDAHLCASSPRIRKNNALKPERSMSFNLSSDIEKNMFSAGLSIFRTNISDKVVLEEYSGSDDSYDLEWANAEGEAYTQGLELRGGFEYRLFEFEAAYVLTDARYEEEQIQGNERSIHIPRSPMHTGNIDVSLFSNPDGERFFDAWRLNVGLNIVGSMHIERDGDVVDAYPEESLDEIVKTEPYATVDARLSKRINQIGLDVYVAAGNLTNTVQNRKPWDVDDAAMVYAPLYGTTVNVGFTKSF